MTIENDTMMADFYFHDAIRIDHGILADHIRVRKEVKMSWMPSGGQVFYAGKRSTRHWEWSLDFPASTLYIIGESAIQ